jgi:hypothetical protein
MTDRLRQLARRPVAAGAALLLSVCLAAVAVVRITSGGDGDLPSSDDSSAVVARDFALAVTTFDYRDAQGSIDRVLAFGDDGFEEEFRTAMGADFLTNLEAAQSISTGQVVSGPTAQRSNDGTTSYLVIVDQTIQSAAPTTTAADGSAPAAAQPQVLHLGMLVTVDTGTDEVTAVEVL